MSGEDSAEGEGSVCVCGVFVRIYCNYKKTKDL